MITTFESFANDFLFANAETCDIKAYHCIAHCSKHTIVPGIVVIAMVEQNSRENFLRRMSSDSSMMDMLLLPQQHIALELTGEISRHLGKHQWGWLEEYKTPKEFTNGKIYGCPVGRLVNAVRDWFKADLAKLAIEEAKRIPKDIGYAKREAYDVFLTGGTAEKKIEEELNAIITHDGHNSDLYLPTELFVDYLLHKDDDALHKKWAARLFDPDHPFSVHDRAVQFGNWYNVFDPVYQGYEQLPDTAPEKQYKTLLTAIQCAQNVQADFGNGMVKVSVSDITQAVMDYVRDNNTTIGYGKVTPKLRDLQTVMYRGKTIWKRI